MRHKSNNHNHNNNNNFKEEIASINNSHSNQNNNNHHRHNPNPEQVAPITKAIKLLQFGCLWSKKAHLKLKISRKQLFKLNLLKTLCELYFSHSLPLTPCDSHWLSHLKITFYPHCSLISSRTITSNYSEIKQKKFFFRTKMPYP